jgi:excisionase family DNA binding protein
MKIIDLPEIMSAAMVGEYLGVDRKVIYDLLNNKSEYGGLISFRVGTQRRIRKDDLMNWIDNQLNGNTPKLKAVK